MKTRDQVKTAGGSGVSDSIADTNAEQAADIANIVVEIFARQNQELQASRYAESKTSLEEQLARLNGQIHNAGTALDSLGSDPQDENERTRLEAELVQYRQTYSQLLQRILNLGLSYKPMWHG